MGAHVVVHVSTPLGMHVHQHESTLVIGFIVLCGRAIVHATTGHHSNVSQWNVSGFYNALTSVSE